MSISDRIDALQQRATDLKSSFDQSKKETSEQVKQRLGKARADIEARQDAVKAKAGQAAGHAQSQWAAMKADATARQAAFRDRIDRKRDEHDVKVAERDAEDAEDDAADALDYAAWVVDQAQLAVLDAVDARTGPTPSRRPAPEALQPRHALASHASSSAEPMVAAA